MGGLGELPLALSRHGPDSDRLPQVKEGFTDWGHIGKLNGNRRILKFAKKIRQLLFVSERGSVSRCGIAGIIIKPLIE